MPAYSGNPAADAYAAYYATGPSGYLPVDDPTGGWAAGFHGNMGRVSSGGPQGMMFNIGRGIRGSAEHGLLNSIGSGLSAGLDMGAVPGAVTLGVPGYLLGLGLGKVGETFGAGPGTAGRLANILGLAGLGLGGYSGWQRAKYREANASYDPESEKSASYGDDDQIFIRQALARAGLSDFDRSRLMSQVRQMSDDQRAQVRSLIVQLGMGAAAAIIARVAGMGLTASLVTGVVGSQVGSNTIDTARRLYDSFLNPGRPAQQAFDGYGDPYYL